MKNLVNKSLWLIVLFLLVQVSIFAQTGSGFFENKGQWEGDFQFKANIPSGNFFITPTGYTILQYNGEDLNRAMGHVQSPLEKKIEPVKIKPIGEDGKEGTVDRAIRKHAYRVSFLGGTKSTKAKGEKPTGDRSNFYLGNDPSKWKTDIQSFSAVRVENMYPGIDVKYYTYNDKIKFDILVEPGANPSLIKVKYEGADKIEVIKGELVITTSLGIVKELKPYAYQVVGGTKVEIPCSYVLANNQVSYKIQGYNKNAPLVIDPEYLWLSTYSGSYTDNWGYTAAPGPDKSIYAAGIVAGNGYPTTTGAYQTRNNSDRNLRFGWDVAITRYAQDGNDPKSVPDAFGIRDKGPIFSTYIGGYGDDYPHSLIVANNGDVVILGRTNSEETFPHSNVWGDMKLWDIYAFRLNEDGKFVGSWLIGGEGDDGYNHSGSDNLPIKLNQGVPYRLNYGDCSRSEVVLDDQGNVFIAANTQSNNFPTKNAAFPRQGNQDGVLIKIKNDFKEILFSTYIGGSGFDAAVCLGYDTNTRRVLVGGYTESANFKGIEAGTLGGSFKGGLDGFLSVFENNGTPYKSTYLGTSNYDFIYAVQVDQTGYPYVLGISYGNWLVKNAPASISTGKQFVAKLEKDLSDFIFSNRFGSGANNVHDISPIAFLVDDCNRIFIAGFINSPDSYCESNQNAMNMVVVDPLKGKTQAQYARGDGKDFYFIVFEPDCAAVKFATFWGQQGGTFDHVDGGTSRFDKQGIIYMASCANCPIPSGCDPVDLGYSFPIKNNTSPRRAGNDGKPCNMHALIYDLGLGQAKAEITPFIDGVAFKKNGCNSITARLIGSSSGAKAILPVSGRLPEQSGVTYNWEIELVSNPGVIIGTATGRDIDYPFTHISSGPSVTEYLVRLKVFDDNKACDKEDETTTVIEVGIDEADLNAEYVYNCSKDVVFKNLSNGGSLAFTPTSFIWNFDGRDQSATGIADVPYRFPSFGRYTAILKLNDDQFCNNGDTIHVDVFITDVVKATLNYPSPVCLDRTGKARVEFKAGGGPNVKWQISDPSGIPIFNQPAGLSASYEFNTSGIYKVKIDVNDPNACVQNDQEEAFVAVNPSPISGFRFSTPQENTPVSFTNLSDDLSPANRRFLWDFNDGDTSNQVNPSHLFNFIRPHKVKLVAIAVPSGCRDSTILTLTPKVSPLVNIPNAFTPLAATNNRFNIIGYGVIQVNLKIFNRWGVKVFDSQISKFKAWDGTFNGQLQPMDVYSYLAEVYFANGERETLTGNVTLIR